MRKGQVTIWIILGLVLVGSISLFFTLERGPKPLKLPGETTSFDTSSFLASCLERDVEESVDEMLLQGGFLLPKNSVFFDTTNIEYLCKNTGAYLPCVNQHPLLIDELEKQIHDRTLPLLEGCFAAYEEVVKERGNDFFADGATALGVELGPDRIFLTINKDVTIRELGDARIFDEFRVALVHPAYNLATVAREIADQESRFCYFEFVGYSIFYPRFVVRKYVLSEPTEIYRIEDVPSGKIMNVAIRSCAIPPGGLT